MIIIIINQVVSCTSYVVFRSVVNELTLASWKSLDTHTDYRMSSIGKLTMGMEYIEVHSIEYSLWEDHIPYVVSALISVHAKTSLPS